MKPDNFRGYPISQDSVDPYGKSKRQRRLYRRLHRFYRAFREMLQEMMPFFQLAVLLSQLRAFH